MTMDQRSAVVCTFENRDQAERAMDALRAAGFPEGDIGFAMRGEANTIRDRAEEDPGAGAGAATGAITGGVIAGAAAAGMIPGVGPILAGGILAGVIGGAVVGALTGGIAGALIHLGVSDDEAHYYEGEFSSGHPVVTVRAMGRYAEARTIMNRYGRCGYNDPDALADTSVRHDVSGSTPLGSDSTRRPYLPGTPLRPDDGLGDDLTRPGSGGAVL